MCVKTYLSNFDFYTEVGNPPVRVPPPQGVKSGYPLRSGLKKIMCNP